MLNLHRDINGPSACMTSHEQIDENLRAMAETFGASDNKLLDVQLAAISSSYCACAATAAESARKVFQSPMFLLFLTYAEGYG